VAGERDLAKRISSWLLPAWIFYSAAWIVYWGYRILFAGGLEPGDAVSMGMSGVTGALGLVTGWLVRRGGP
jgi:hypothetical protein